MRAYFNGTASGESTLTQFVFACRDGDVAEATRLARSPDITPDAARSGVIQFLTKHKIYTGLDALMARSDIGKSEGATVAFVNDALHGAVLNKDKFNVVKFVNGHKLKYDVNAFLVPLIRSDDSTCLEIIRSTRFDVTEKHSIALVYAATQGRKDVFAELVKYGADPKDALINGPADNPGYAPGYRNLAQWSAELYATGMAHTAKQKVNDLFPHLRTNASIKF